MNDDREPERYYDWMLWKMRKEREKCKLKDVLMNPLEASRRIVKLEERLDELERALVAERTDKTDHDR